MTTQTEEAQVVAEGAVSVERALGRLEGKNDLLIRMVDGQGHQSQENNRKLDTKIDTVKSDLDVKIDKAKSDLDTKIDAAKSELNAKIDTVKSDLDAKIDTTKSELEAKIDKAKSDLDAKIDRTKSELDAKIDTAKSELDAKIDAKTDRLLYWILGVGGFMAVTVVGSALAVIFAQR